MIRAYQPTDKEEVLTLLRLNTPAYFDPSEEKDLINYLDHEIEEYYVYENNKQIIGAGGINYFYKEKQARISWDMIHPNSQGLGIGKDLTQFRLDRIKNNINIDSILVRTTQLVYPFYEKMGFILERIEKDFWAENIDLYQMKIVL